VDYAAAGLTDAPGRGWWPGRALVRAATLALAATLLAACASQPRAPEGSCMQRTMDSLDLSGLPSPRMHCVAAGTIEQRCGWFASVAAGLGKEFADAFGPGDAQWSDLKANAAGRDCARRADDPAALPDCCAAAGY